MVPPTQSGEVGRPGLTGWTIPVVGVDVIEVAGPRVAAAPGKDAVPVAEEDVSLHDRSVRGRVVDLEGRAVESAQVRLLPFDPDGDLRYDRSDEQGEFVLENLRAGEYRLRVLGRFASSAALDFSS